MRGGAEFMRQGRGLRIATAGVRTGFAMTLTISEARPTKSLAEFAARGRPQGSPLRKVFRFCVGRRALTPPRWRGDYRAAGCGQPALRIARILLKKAVPKDSLFEIGGNYSSMSITTPEPTVRPPSRIAKRRPFSIAMGVISSTFMSTLSPGMHISVPSGRVMTPVTSVVRK